MAQAKDRDGIQKLGPGSYRVVVELARGADGKRRRIQKVVRGTRAEALAFQTELRAQKLRGILVGQADQPFGSYLRSWLETKRDTVASRTFERYETIAASVCQGVGGIALGKLTTQHLNEYYAACRSEVVRPRSGRSHRGKASGSAVPRALSPTTIHHRHVVIKMALKAAVEDGLIVRNPADRAAAPRPCRKELRLIDEREASAILAAVRGSNLELLVWLGLHTGARIGELLALRWTDIDLERHVMLIRRTLVEPLRRQGDGDWFSFKEPKSGHGRAVDLDEGTVQRLKRARAQQAELRLSTGSAWRDLDLVLPTEDGAPQRPSYVSSRFRRTIESAGVDGVRFHDLRHGHATMLLRQGFPPHVVQRRLGHSDPAFTLRVYAGVLPNQEREAADAFAASLRRAQGDV